jgi:hypothetical protein
MTNQTKGERNGIAGGTPAGPPAAEAAQGWRQPYLTVGGDLVIPFDSDPKYHWWKGGQSVRRTLAEVRAKLEGEKQQNAAGAQVSAAVVVT